MCKKSCRSSWSASDWLQLRAAETARIFLAWSPDPVPLHRQTGVRPVLASHHQLAGDEKAQMASMLLEDSDNDVQPPQPPVYGFRIQCIDDVRCRRLCGRLVLCIRIFPVPEGNERPTEKAALLQRTIGSCSSKSMHALAKPRVER